MVARCFDNAASTPLDPRVLEAMLPFLQEECGNAHAQHGMGRKARAAVEAARVSAAELLGAEDPSEIIFTSGATESNATVLRSFQRLAVSPVEHKSVYEAGLALGATVLPSAAGEFDLSSVMWVNNETGAIYLGAGAREATYSAASRYRHSDITQAAAKLPISLKDTDLDLASLSGHKMHAPKGVGALYVRAGTPLQPLLVGGGQENGLRAGTLNVAGIVGLGEAARISLQEREADFALAAKLKAIVLEGLKGVSDWQVNGQVTSPFILSVGFAGIEGALLAVELDRMGYALGSGSACSSGSEKPSHILAAMGVDEKFIRGTVRISFGRFSTEDETASMTEELKKALQRLRAFAF